MKMIIIFFSKILRFLSYERADFPYNHAVFFYIYLFIFCLFCPNTVLEDPSKRVRDEIADVHGVLSYSSLPQILFISWKDICTQYVKNTLSMSEYSHASEILLLQPLVIFKCFLWEGSFFMFFFKSSPVSLNGMLQAFFKVCFALPLSVHYLLST